MMPNTMTGSVIDGPKIKTALPGPNAKRVLEGDDRYISTSYTRSYPLVAKQGRGIVVTEDRKSTRLNSVTRSSRMPSSA